MAARMLPEPATNTTAVWMRVYREFIPSRQGVTMVLLITDWNTNDAPPMAKAVMSMTIELGGAEAHGVVRQLALAKLTSTSR